MAKAIKNRNAWAVQYRFTDNDDNEWQTQCWYPAIDIIEYDGEVQGKMGQPIIDIGRGRAYNEAHRLEQSFGSGRIETLVRFVHNPNFVENEGKEIVLKARYDAMLPA